MLTTRINGIKVTVNSGDEFVKITRLLLPSVDTRDTRDCYREGYADGYSRGIEDMSNEKLYNDAYNQGLEDAWECARKIGKVNWLTLEKMGFNNKDKEKNPSWDVIMEYSPSEAMAKIKEYEDNEIKVGDEVRHKMGDKKIVTQLDAEYLYTINSDGYVYEGTRHEFVKTGKHYPQVAEMLKQIREE